MSGHLNRYEELTIYIIHSGEDTYDECLEALHNQDCTFKIDYIRDVSPMSLAFQTMPDRCETKYFVQVDADMILHPHAIRTLYEAINQSSFFTYMVHGRLYEEGFGIGGAIKCWKRSIFRFFQFRDVRTVDRDLHRRLRRCGLRRKGLDEVLGIHRPRYSDFSIYLKAKSDIEKWRFLKRPAAKYALNRLDEALQDYPNTRLQLFGICLGALTGAERVVRSKNTPLEKVKFEHILNFLGQDEILSNVVDSFDSEAINLKRTFVQSYEDYRTRNSKKRQAMAALTLDLFSNHSSNASQVKAFLEIIDQ